MKTSKKGANAPATEAEAETTTSLEAAISEKVDAYYLAASEILEALGFVEMTVDEVNSVVDRYMQAEREIVSDKSE